MLFRRHRWLIAGLLSIALGYVLLAGFESLSLAPILLVLGYCLLIPMHLWSIYRSDSGNERSQTRREGGGGPLVGE